jgi:hypothetical protein
MPPCRRSLSVSPHRRIHWGAPGQMISSISKIGARAGAVDEDGLHLAHAGYDLAGPRGGGVTHLSAIITAMRWATRYGDDDVDRDQCPTRLDRDGRNFLAIRGVPCQMNGAAWSRTKSPPPSPRVIWSWRSALSSCTSVAIPQHASPAIQFFDHRLNFLQHLWVGDTEGELAHSRGVGA